MTRALKAALNTERTPTGEYQWVLSYIDSTVGTMPQLERSARSYATEEEARQAGQARVDELNVH